MVDGHLKLRISHIK